MSGIVTNTADVLAIIGGATTLLLGVFAAVRLSRCQTVSCCWGALNLVNKPLPVAPPLPAALVRGESDLTGVAVQA